MEKPSAPDLLTYLNRSRFHIHKKSIDLLVMGNEASDLDSMVSSITLAYIKGKKDKVAVPLMPIVRDDFKLRTEAVYLFDRAGINTALLVFLDDIELPGWMEKVNRLALVDHNRLSWPFESYPDKVSMILDHHKDQGLYPHVDTRVISPVGSCATLVGEILIRNYPDLIHEQMAVLLAGTILLDTINLDTTAGRVTPRDIKTAQSLLKSCLLDRDEFFKEIQNAKFNTSYLNAHDLLRKDYKAFRSGGKKWGIASLPLSMEDWDKKAVTLCHEFENFAGTHHLDILISMNAYHDPLFTRAIGVYAPDPDSHDRLIRFLQGKGLRLSPLFLDAPPVCRQGRISFHLQGNKEISRKKLSPLLENYFSGSKPL